jgi:hypothetical protein
MPKQPSCPRYLSLTGQRRSGGACWRRLARAGRTRPAAGCCPQRACPNRSCSPRPPPGSCSAGPSLWVPPMYLASACSHPAHGNRVLESRRGSLVLGVVVGSVGGSHCHHRPGGTGQLRSERLECRDSYRGREAHPQRRHRLIRRCCPRHSSGVVPFCRVKKAEKSDGSRKPCQAPIEVTDREAGWASTARSKVTSRASLGSCNSRLAGRSGLSPGHAAHRQRAIAGPSAELAEYPLQGVHCGGAESWPA